MDTHLQANELEALLARAMDIGQPVKIRSYREIWRLPLRAEALYLKWYPRAGTAAKRALRGSPAAREYERLLWLQRAGISAPRAAAFAGGLVLNERKGDGVLTWAAEPSVTVEAAVGGGLAIAERRRLGGQIVELLRSLVKARLGHSDLHLGNLLVFGNEMMLLDAYSVHRGGLDARDMEVLGFGVSGVATRTELLRGWRGLGGQGALPALAGRVARRHWRKVVKRATGETAYAGRVRAGWGGEVWTGMYFKSWKTHVAHAAASGLTATAEDWRREWPRLVESVRGGMLKALKRGPSGEVWEGCVVLGGVPVEVVVKRPLRRYAYRYVTELGRGTRAWRAWRKGWMLTARGIATAWPLAVMERRIAGVVVDQMIVCERVVGEQLDVLDLKGLDSPARELLFRRVGKVLRKIDETRIVHFDTKASNFMVRWDAMRGPEVVLVDVDGVRGYSWRGEGIRRLEASLRKHQPRLIEADITALRFGYDPYVAVAAPIALAKAAGEKRGG